MEIVISHKEKSYQTEADSAQFSGKKIGDEIDGSLVKAEAAGYKLVITGGSDSSGFPMRRDVHGQAIKKIVIGKGTGMRKTVKGLRMAKRVHGNTVEIKIAQLNTKVVLEGEKKLDELFPKTEKKEEKDKNKDKKKK